MVLGAGSGGAAGPAEAPGTPPVLAAPGVPPDPAPAVPLGSNPPPFAFAEPHPLSTPASTTPAQNLADLDARYLSLRLDRYLASRSAHTELASRASIAIPDTSDDSGCSGATVLTLSGRGQPSVNPVTRKMPHPP